MVQAAGRDAPNDQIRHGRNPDVRVGRILRLQHDAGGRDSQPLDGQFSVQDGYDYGPVLGFQGPVDDQFIPVADAGAFHRVSGDPHDVRAGDVLDQMLVQVNPPIKVVLGRRGVPGRDGDRRDQHRQQRHARIYHAGTDNNAHNTPLFEYMFDTFSVAGRTDKSWTLPISLG